MNNVNSKEICYVGMVLLAGIFNDVLLRKGYGATVCMCKNCTNVVVVNILTVRCTCVGFLGRMTHKTAQKNKESNSDMNLLKLNLTAATI